MEQSIAFGHEELVVLAGLLGERLPSLGDDPLAELAPSARQRLLEAGEQSLRARNVVTTDDGSVRVALAAARLLEITCRPNVAVTVHRDDGAGWLPHPTRVACIPGASVSTVWDAAAYRMTPFATVDVLTRLAKLVGIEHDLRPAVDVLSVDHGTLATVLATSSPAVRRDLFDSGPGDLAPELVDALVTADAVAVRVARRPVGGNQAGAEVAWLTSTAGTWELPVSATPLGGSGPAPRPADLVLVPATGAALLTVIAESLAESS